MSILQSLFGKKPKYVLLGNLEPICPYCATALGQMPGKKKKCPHCSQFIYIRTRPGDGKKVAVTEADAEKIDVQWMQENGTYDQYLAEQKEREAVKADIAKKSGSTPTDSDVQWGLHNRHLITHAKNGDWGLYRNTRYAMAEQLRKEGKLQTALETYLEVAYIDANGPNNTGNMKDMPAFDAELAFEAPALVKAICKAAEKLDLSEVDLQVTYLKVASVLHQRLRFPVKPESGWEGLSSAIRKLR